MDVVQKITLLNNATLESLNKSGVAKIVEKFTKIGLKIFKGDFGFVFWKESKRQPYRLIYKTPNTPYEPNSPRKHGYNRQVEKTLRPYIGRIKKERVAKYDLTKYMKNIIIIPITYKKQIYGNMALCFKRARKFSREEHSLTVALGNGAAQAITIGRLHTNLEKLVDERTRDLIREIAKHKETGRRLRESRHFTEQITNITPGMIAVHNVHTGNYLYVNSAIREILGYMPEDFLKGGMPFAGQLVHPDDARAIAQKNQEALDEANRRTTVKYDNIIIPFEYRMRHKNGKWVWLNTYGTIFNRKDGKVEHVLNISVDITARKEMEEKLQADHAKDEALLSSIGEGILATDNEGKIILINPQAEKILSVTKSEAMGKSVFEAFNLYDDRGQPVKKERRPTYQVLKNSSASNAVSASQGSIMGRDGLLPISILATPITRHGATVGAILVIRNISREKEIDRVKSELISLASHQLRTPLSTINWYAESLMKEELGKLNSGQKKYLQEIFHANQKMVELVYDFLNVSRVELGTFTLKLSVVDVSKIAQSVIKELQPILSRKNISVAERYGRNLQAIEADRKIIRLTLQNLLTNAAKYTPDGGKIKVRIEIKKQPHPVLSITVADNGFGIPKQQQSKVFTKLFRGDNTAKLDTEGSGLGLYLVKSFVDYCKGSITFKSEEDRGTTFFVNLPVRTAA